MGPDEARMADTAGWLSKAHLDLRSAEHALTAPEPLREDAVFHCQQAVEKAMKALLTWHDVPFRRTHSLEELGQQCLPIDATLQSIVDEAAPLSQYAWQFRYPGETDPPTQQDTDDALRIARAALAAVLARVPPSVRPKAG